MYRYGPRRPPSWWPENEPWPPRGPHAWRARRRFVRRASGIFFVLMFLSVFGAVRLLSLLFRPWAYGPRPLFPPFAEIAIFVLLLCVVVVAMRQFAMPLGDIVGAANRLAGGDYSARVPEHGPPSLRTVARAFNGMAARLQAQEEQRRHLMADIAHELRTPLTVIQGRLEGLIDGVYPRDETRLSEVLDDTRTLARLVDDLRTLSNAESGTLALRKEPTDLTVLVRDAAKAFSADASARHVTLDVDGSTDLPLVDIDPVRIREVLTNLLSNALHYTGARGTVSIRYEVRAREVVVRVSDTGEGMSAEEVSKIFDRFYKGRGSHGSGLGLTIARNLVEAHGGRIRADSRLGSGTTIEFTLPENRG